MLTRCTFCLAVALILALPAGSVETLTAADLLRRVEDRLKILNDYECEVDTECRVGGRREARRMRLWVKKPALLRVKVLAGKDRGSEVCIGRSGKIRGRKGGILKAIAVNLNPNDSRLKNLRGMPLTALEWGGSLQRIRETAALPGTRLTLAPRRNASDPFELSLAYRSGGRALREIFRFDPQRYTITEGEVYENEALVDRAVFRNVRLNSGLNEQWFRF